MPETAHLLAELMGLAEVVKGNQTSQQRSAQTTLIDKLLSEDCSALAVLILGTLTAITAAKLGHTPRFQVKLTPQEA